MALENWGLKEAKNFVENPPRPKCDAAPPVGVPRVVIFELRVNGTPLEISRIGPRYYVTNGVTKRCFDFAPETAVLWFALRSGIVELPG